MTKQIGCVDFDDFCTAQDQETNQLLVAQAIVIWAGEQTEPGEWVGGIGEQNQRSAKNLRLHVGIIERARALRGPEMVETIWTAYQEFLARLAVTPPPRRNSVYTAQLIPFETIQRVVAPTQEAPRMRQKKRATG